VIVKDDRNLTGNARYEGFCIDLLKWIASQVGFHYVIRLVPDHMYGVYDPQTKEWNGIVRELMEKVSVHAFNPQHHKLVPVHHTYSLFNSTKKKKLNSMV
jgi:hypothetical protein